MNRLRAIKKGKGIKRFMTIIQHAPRTQSSKSQPQQWKLLEMVHLSDDPTDPDAGAPLQWLKLAGSNPDQQEPILILGGFQGSVQNDNRVLQLLQKALSSGIIQTCSDIYLCPIVNPSCRNSEPHLNRDRQDIMNSFPLEGFTDKLPMESQAIINWVERIQPKAIITLDSGENLINQNGVADDLLEKVAALAEREVLSIGEKPTEEIQEEPQLNALGMPIEAFQTRTFSEDSQLKRSLEFNIGKWCEEKEIIWINFSITSDKMSFEEIREDWRMNLGPAMKWIFEGPRFNPPEEDPVLDSPTVVPTLDLPPELMNL